MKTTRTKAAGQRTSGSAPTRPVERTSKTPAKRGRPSTPKPSPEELRDAVRVECWKRLALVVIEGNCDGHPPEMAQKAFLAFLKALQPNRNLQAGLQAQYEIREAYRQLCAFIDTYAHVRDLLHSEVFSEAEDFVRLFGIEPQPEGIGGFTLRHMLKMQPHLDALLGEMDITTTIATYEAPTKPADTARSKLLSYFYIQDKGWFDTLRIGRLMTWRELAMVSILAGQWPSVNEGHVSTAKVIEAEKKAIRMQATRMGIQAGSLPNWRDELWGYVDFCRTRFFTGPLCASPFRIEGSRSMNPKELRLAAGLSIERCAVAAGVTSPTIRLFEADPSAAPRARAKLETFYTNLQVRLASGANTSPPAAA